MDEFFRSTLLLSSTTLSVKLHLFDDHVEGCIGHMHVLGLA